MAAEIQSGDNTHHHDQSITWHSLRIINTIVKTPANEILKEAPRLPPSFSYIIKYLLEVFPGVPRVQSEEEPLLFVLAFR